jgi:hypothetical protein
MSPLPCGVNDANPTSRVSAWCSGPVNRILSGGRRSPSRLMLPQTRTESTGASSAWEATPPTSGRQDDSQRVCYGLGGPLGMGGCTPMCLARLAQAPWLPRVSFDSILTLGPQGMPGDVSSLPKLAPRHPAGPVIPSLFPRRGLRAARSSESLYC